MVLLYEIPLLYGKVLDRLVPVLGAHIQPIPTVFAILPTSFGLTHQLVLLYTDALQDSLYNHEY